MAPKVAMVEIHPHLKCSTTLKGYKHTLETRQKMGRSRKGMKRTPETRAKMSEVNKTDPAMVDHAVALYQSGLSVEDAAQISGVTRSPIYRALKERSIPTRGKESKPHTLETRQKMSKTRKALGFRPSLVKAQCQRWSINCGKPCRCGQHTD